MDNAVATVMPKPLATRGNSSDNLVQIQPVSGFAAMPLKAKLMLAMGAAGLLAVLVTLLLWNQAGGGNYRVLYANLSDKDGGAIISQLSQMGIPYRHAEGGSAILVPAAQVHDARLKLATQGLPKGSVNGFELMDSARFGQTQFQERLTFQRGLEGELTRSISSIGSVQAARVHLALPQQNGFFREQQKPSASVVLTLHPGRQLDRAQVAGIVHLVSSSVSELSPKAVSVVDQTGALLSSPSDGLSGQGLDAQQLQYVQQVEANYVKRVVELLEPIVGRDNLRASVTAEVDFTVSEATSEQFRPNQGTEPATVRSLQTMESNTATPAAPSGVPGAASNQPPAQAAAPTNGPTQNLQAAQTGSGQGNVRKENVTNFEVDKTVRVVRAPTGVVKRLNAAVVVNHRSNTDAKGKSTTTPLSAEDIEKLTALVQEGIGFSKDRGDSVKVLNVPFKVEPLPKPVEVPIWKQPETLDTLRGAIVPVALIAVALMLVFGVIKPALKAAEPPPVPVGAALSEVADEAIELPPPPPPKPPALEAPAGSDKLAGARALARDNPVAVANIVRGWVNGEAA